MVKDTTLRKNTREDIEKAATCYSFGLGGEAVFALGKILERLSKEYLKALINAKKIRRKIDNFDKLDFDSCINILNKEKKITPNQYSKILSIKWDRNTFGHSSSRKQIKESFESVKPSIEMAKRLIYILESKISKNR